MKLNLSNKGRERLHSARRVCGIAAVLLFASLPASAAGNEAQDEVTRNFDKTLTLGAGQSVRVEHKFGEVRVHGESGREVRISAVIRAQASSHEEAESFGLKFKKQGKASACGRFILPRKISGFISASIRPGRSTMTSLCPRTRL